MSELNLGIIGGGQLGSLLSAAAKKLNINTIIYCDDNEAPAQNFCNEFIFEKGPTKTLKFFSDIFCIVTSFIKISDFILLTIFFAVSK